MPRDSAGPERPATNKLWYLAGYALLGSMIIALAWAAHETFGYWIPILLN